MTCKKIEIFFKSFIFFFLFFSLINSNDQFELLIGTVDEQAVTSYELNQRIKILINTLQLDDNIENRDKVRESALDKLIEDKLKISEAKKLEISIQVEELESFLSQVFQFPVEKKKEFSKFLDQQGIDEDIVKEQAEAELLWNKIITQKFSGFISVSQLEIEEEKNVYEKNQGSVQFNFSEIIINKSNDDKKSLKKIQQIKELLSQNTNFSSVASKFSNSPSSLQGGSMGWMFSSQIENTTRKELEKISKGQISEIINTQNSYKIVRLNNKRIYGEKNKRNYTIMNFSSSKDNVNFINFMRNVRTCDQKFKNSEFSENVDFDKIERIEIDDFSDYIQNDISKRKIGEKTKIFNSVNKQFFFLVCNIFGGEIAQIDEKQIENNIYNRKIRQLSRTHLNKIKKLANINIGIE